MKARLGGLSALLVAGVAAAVVAAAPAALAQSKCTTTSEGDGVQGDSTTVCQSPGDAEISTTPPENAQHYWGSILPFENYGPAIL